MVGPQTRQCASKVARFFADQAGARAVADLLDSVFDAQSVATALYEEPDGRWGLAFHFRDPLNETAVRSLIAAACGTTIAEAFVFETVEPRDWVQASLEGLTPVEAGRFVVHTSHYRDAVRSNRIGIEIEAALAFGTGHHGSTRGCLMALHALAKRQHQRRKGSDERSLTRRRERRATVLDVGTGTGVLAIAAAKTLRRRVLASDIDPRAVTVARGNARLNGVGAMVEVIHAADAGTWRLRQRGPFILIFANILLKPLQRLATSLAGLAAPNGTIVLAGLLVTQAGPAAASYRARGLILARRIVLGGWVTLVLARPRLRRAASRGRGRLRS